MARAGTLTADDLAELERHVRDAVADLERVGLSVDEALLVSLRRVGDPSVLAVEYLKVNPGLAWARRWYWMTAGFLVFSLALAGIEALSHAGALLTLGRGSASTWFGVFAVAGLGALCFAMLRSAAAPGGRVARSVQRVTEWVARRPLVAGQLGFVALASLTLLNRFATGFAWRTVGLEALSAITFYDAVAATVAPIGLFLLGWHINRHDEGVAGR